MRPFSTRVTNAVNRDDGKLSEGYKYRSVGNSAAATITMPVAKMEQYWP